VYIKKNHGIVFAYKFIIIVTIRVYCTNSLEKNDIYYLLRL